MSADMLEYIKIVPEAPATAAFITRRDGRLYWGFGENGIEVDPESLFGYPGLMRLRTPMAIESGEHVFRIGEDRFYVSEHEADPHAQSIPNGVDLKRMYNAAENLARLIGRPSVGTLEEDERRIDELAIKLSHVRGKVEAEANLLQPMPDDLTALEALEKEMLELCLKYNVPYDRFALARMTKDLRRRLG